MPAVRRLSWQCPRPYPRRESADGACSDRQSLGRHQVTRKPQCGAHACRRVGLDPQRSERAIQSRKACTHIAETDSGAAAGAWIQAYPGIGNTKNKLMRDLMREDRDFSAVLRG